MAGNLKIHWSGLQKMPVVESSKQQPEWVGFTKLKTTVSIDGSGLIYPPDLGLYPIDVSDIYKYEITADLNNDVTPEVIKSFNSQNLVQDGVDPLLQKAELNNKISVAKYSSLALHTSWDVGTPVGGGIPQLPEDSFFSVTWPATIINNILRMRNYTAITPTVGTAFGKRYDLDFSDIKDLQLPTTFQGNTTMKQWESLNPDFNSRTQFLIATKFESNKAYYNFYDRTTTTFLPSNQFTTFEFSLFKYLGLSFDGQIITKKLIPLFCVNDTTIFTYPSELAGVTGDVVITVETELLA